MQSDGNENEAFFASSQPLLSFKVEEHQQGHNEHEAHGQGVAVGSVELGHVPSTGLGIEIHAVDACGL